MLKNSKSGFRPKELDLWIYAFMVLNVSFVQLEGKVL